MEKIGLFIGTLEGGGAERVVLNLANEFCRREIPVELILRFKKGVYLKELNPKIEIQELNENNPFLIIYKLYKVCRDRKIRKLLSISRYNNVLALFCNLFMRITVLVREANTFDELLTKRLNIGDRIKNFLIFHSMKILYPMAKKVIANSIDTAKDISNYIKITEEKIVVINNPLVSERLYYLSQKPIGDHHFCRLDRPLIISIGRLVTQKNFNFLIESFLIVKKRIPSANLIILGKGPLEYELKNLAIKLNLEDSVHFLGFIENPYNFLKASDVFVLSSLFEGFGNVLVEALSVGVPIVSTDCAGGPREILDNGLYGKLVPLGDKQFMADAIIDTINNKPKALQLLNRSKNYGIKSITDKYLKEIIY